MTPISAAGVPPRKTIARTRARKLPEIFSLRFGLDRGQVAEDREAEQDREAGPRSQLAFGRLPDRGRDHDDQGDRQDRRGSDGVGRSVSMDRALVGYRRRRLLA